MSELCDFFGSKMRELCDFGVKNEGIEDSPSKIEGAGGSMTNSDECCKGSPSATVHGRPRCPQRQLLPQL